MINSFSQENNEEFENLSGYDINEHMYNTYSQNEGFENSSDGKNELDDKINNLVSNYETNNKNYETNYYTLPPIENMPTDPPTIENLMNNQFKSFQGSYKEDLINTDQNDDTEGETQKELNSYFDKLKNFYNSTMHTMQETEITTLPESTTNKSSDQENFITIDNDNDIECTFVNTYKIIFYIMVLLLIMYILLKLNDKC